MSNEPTSNEEKEADTSSSSSGKEGSGGGYSADYSGSDQSLDGNNKNSAEDEGENDDDKPVEAKALQDDASAQKKHRSRSSERKVVAEEEGFDVWEGLDDDEDEITSDQNPLVAAGTEGLRSTTDAPFAQWNGINVSNPMDKRIDFSTMASATAAYSEYMQQEQANKQQSSIQKEPPKQQGNQATSVSLESYARLLEVSANDLKFPF